MKDNTKATITFEQLKKLVKEGIGEGQAVQESFVVNKGITVKELLNQCRRLVADGHGDKYVLISQDDECNGFHSAFDGLEYNPKTNHQWIALGMIDRRYDPTEIALLK